MNSLETYGCWHLLTETRTLAKQRAFNVECIHCGSRRVMRVGILAMRAPSHRGCSVHVAPPPPKEQASLLPSTDYRWARWAEELQSGAPSVSEWSAVKLAEVRAWVSNRAAERRRVLEPVRVRTWERVVVP